MITLCHPAGGNVFRRKKSLLHLSLFLYYRHCQHIILFSLHLHNIDVGDTVVIEHNPHLTACTSNKIGLAPQLSLHLFCSVSHFHSSDVVHSAASSQISWLTIPDLACNPLSHLCIENIIRIPDKLYRLDSIILFLVI